METAAVGYFQPVCMGSDCPDGNGVWVCSVSDDAAGLSSESAEIQSVLGSSAQTPGQLSPPGYSSCQNRASLRKFLTSNIRHFNTLSVNSSNTQVTLDTS